MKLLIIDCFNNYDIRVKPVIDFFEANKFECSYITSNFDHREKSYYEIADKKTTQIEVPKYKKNISIKRLVSHFIFSLKTYKKMIEIKPDYIYVIVPPNSITWFSKRYKKFNKDVKIIFDIYDLWPESLPIGSAKKVPPLTMWRTMRDKSLKYADLVITECNLYQKVLCDFIGDTTFETVYLSKEEINVVSKPQLSDDEINLAYLGSINNIIDIPKIQKIIEEFKELKPVTLHIIGDGESRDEFIDAAKSSGAIVKYHGKIYDSQEKQNIFDKCHFGLNIMKDNVCVGLTMKSIDYFQHGLPIINNIPADTAEMVEKYDVGINIIGKDETEQEYGLNNSKMNYINRNNVSKLYEKNFSTTAFNKKMNEILYILKK